MEIRKYINLARTWAWLLIAIIGITGITAYFIGRNTPPVYLASTLILIDEAPGGNAGNQYAELLVEQQLATTYAELLERRPIFQTVIDQLGLNLTVAQLASKITISTRQESKILRIGVEDTQRELASTIANTLAQVFIEDNEQRQSQRYSESIIKRQQLLEEIATQIEEIETEINGFGETETPEQAAALSRLETQLREAQIRYTQSFTDLEDLRVEQARNTNNLVVVEMAIPPSAPIRPNILTNTLLAMFASAVGAIGIIFIIEYMDDTLKDPTQVEEDTGLSVLGMIAYIQGKSPNDRLVTVHTPRAPISEAFRILRTNLGFSAIDEGLHTIVVSSASPSEGKSTVTGNLGIVMAQAGKQVIVVDADLRLPTQHKLFGMPNNQGLTTAILDIHTPIREHLQETNIPGLCLMTSGPLPPNPAELLNSQRMNQVLEELKHEADLIIFDTPPVLTVTDASILGAKVNGCVLIAEVGKTRREILFRAVETLQKTSSSVFGIVLNRVHQRRIGYDYYYHSSYDYQKRPVEKSLRRLPSWLSGLSNR